MDGEAAGGAHTHHIHHIGTMIHADGVMTVIYAQVALSVGTDITKSHRKK